MKPTLSPKELALATGVSESSVKRWVDEGLIRAARTSGGHRRIVLAEAIRFIRESGISVVRPDVLGMTDLDVARREQVSRQSPDVALQEALVAGRAAEARGIILSMYMSGQPAAEIWDRLISKAMRHIGTLWQHADSGIFLEHRATDICLQAVQHLRATLPVPAAGAPVAIGGGPSADPYALPSLMAATVTAAAGFRDINLGPDTPLDILAQAARHYQARLVWLAVTVERPAEQLQQETEELARRLAEHGALLVVGGRALPEGLVIRRPDAHVAKTMAELEALAKGMLGREARDEARRARGEGRGEDESTRRCGENGWGQGQPRQLPVNGNERNPRG